jgi:ribonuclease HI
MATKKFYAVKVGRKPGIYLEWFGLNGAKAQVDEFPQAVHRGFSTREDAKAFLDGRLIAANSPKPPPKPAIDKKPLPRSKLLIYTDGSCLSNPGPGGYGAVILGGKSRIEFSGGYRLTTNNRMELMACIRALKTLKKPSRVTLYSDSQYVVNGITKGWAMKWRANNWMKKDKSRAENPDLWENLLALCRTHEVDFQWVRGHAETPENLRCDALAKQAASRNDLLPDKGYKKRDVAAR